MTLERADDGATADGPALLRPRNVVLPQAPGLEAELLARLGDAVIAVDAEERVLYWGPAAETLYGLRADEMLGRRLDESHSYSWSNPSEEKACYARLAAEGIWRGRVVHVLRSGVRLDVEATVSVWQRPAPERPGYIAVLRDITERVQAETALARSEELARNRADELATVLDTVPAAVFISRDRAVSALDSNGYGARLLRLGPTQDASFTADPGRRPSHVRVFREGRELAPEELPLQRAADTGAEFRDSELELRFPDGTRTTILGSAVPLRDGAGELRGSVGAFVDVTARKAAEQQLSRTHLRLQALLESLPLGVSFSDDLACQRVQGNPTLLAMFEMRPEDNCSKSAPDEAAAGRKVRYFAGDRELEADDLPLQLAAREQRQVGPLEFDVQLPSGRRWSAIGFGAPVRTTDGEVIGSMAVIVDVTEKKRAEQQLRDAQTLLAASESRFRTMADETPIPIWVTDCEGRNEFVNEAWRRFFRAPGLEQGQWQALVHPDDAEAYVREFTESLREVRPFRARGRVRAGDGSWRWIESVGFPRIGSDGRVLGMAGSSPDVTDLVQAQELLREADRQKNDFLAVLSHELRNPLTPLRSGIHLLRHVPADSEQGRRALDVLERQTDHLARLVDDLLDVTRISRGKIELQNGPLDLSALVEQTCGDHRGLFEARRIALEVSAEPDLWIHADSARIRQMVGNLLQNAMKFSAEGSRVRVQVASDDGQATVSVTDEGAGIPAELLPRLFTPFVQVRDGVHGGLGLGLALVKGLVELHGGTVHAESAGAGQGARFVLRLPLRPGRSSAAASGARHTGTKGRRILVIEDNPEVAGTLAELLELEGHTVTVALGGRAGVDLARRERPEVVLCDLGLPDLDGHGVARALRAEPALAGVRLIALSGYGAPEDRARARDAGFDQHLTKPPVIDRLLSALTDGSSERV